MSIKQHNIRIFACFDKLCKNLNVVCVLRMLEFNGNSKKNLVKHTICVDKSS